MMVNKEDFGLCLTLSFPDNKNNHNHNHNRTPPPTTTTTIPFNLMPPVLPSPAPLWNQTLASADTTTRSFLKGIDVNRLPPPSSSSISVIDCDDDEEDQEEEAGVSSPNSTVSSSIISGGIKRVLDPIADQTSITDEEDGNDPSRKKLRLSKDQSVILEQTFKEHNTLNPKQKMALAKRLGLRPRQVEVWFQNRRARTKLKQTEVDCEFLKRCCENLTEENRRLQKEVQELRALKMSPQFYMQMTPPTTLTMCPSCERVATPPSSASAAPPPPHNHHHHQRPLPINLWATPPTPTPATRQFDGILFQGQNGKR